MNSEAFERLHSILISQDQTLQESPIAISGTKVFQGLVSIRQGLKDLAASASSPSPRPLDAVSPTQRYETNNQRHLPTLSIVSVFSAGLADGINPCAFSTLLFLMSYLSLAKKSKKQTLVIGAVYTSTVFVSYFALGLGLFASLRALSRFSELVSIMRTVLAILIGFLAIANIIDGIADLQGRRKDLALVLPKALRQRIHTTIRRQRNLGFLLGGTALTALMVSLFELACTGQVYLPVIAWMVKKGESSRSLGLLALYNFGFILPLAVLFILAWSGKAIKPIADWFESRVWLSKFILASILIIFLILQLLG